MKINLEVIVGYLPSGRYSGHYR